MMHNRNFSRLGSRSRPWSLTMLTWCAILFSLGLLAFLDSLLNMGEIFRRVNSVMFMLVSLGLLIRTTTKMRSKQVEEYEKRVFTLEQEVKTLKEGRKKLGIG